MSETDLMRQYADAISTGASADIWPGAQLDRLDALDRERRGRPDRLAVAAQWYANQGVPVFPIRPNDKRPLIPKAHSNPNEQATCKRDCGFDGHGLYDATTDPARVADWWSRWPSANIGMPTGRLWDVLDVDGPLGVATMWATRKLGGCLADSLNILGHVITPRDGGHHLYVPVSGRGNGSGIYPGVDYRGTGGYVLVPPSVIDQREYHFTRIPEIPPREAEAK
jgi:hypothetical protein